MEAIAIKMIKPSSNVDKAMAGDIGSLYF